MDKKTRTTAIARTAAAALAALLIVPAIAFADHHEGEGVAAQIKAMIKENNEYVRANLEDAGDTVSKDGSLEYWSSGGLMQWVPADAPTSKYDAFSITPKHIKVIELPGGEAAVAMYYSEGSMAQKGRAPVGHYMTRVLQVFVKEEGGWKVRAAHWSPVAAGAGTSATALD